MMMMSSSVVANANSSTTFLGRQKKQNVICSGKKTTTVRAAGVRSSRAKKSVVVTRAAAGTNIMNENVGNKPVAIVTGASSGLGLWTCKALIDKGYFAVMAVRSNEKGLLKANELGFPKDSYAVMNLELGDLQSVRDFAQAFRRSKYVKNFQALVCNAALYLPNATVPSYTKDGFEDRRASCRERVC